MVAVAMHWIALFVCIAAVADACMTSEEMAQAIIDAVLEESDACGALSSAQQSAERKCTSEDSSARDCVLKVTNYKITRSCSGSDCKESSKAFKQDDITTDYCVADACANAPDLKILAKTKHMSADMVNCLFVEAGGTDTAKFKAESSWVSQFSCPKSGDKPAVSSSTSSGTETETSGTAASRFSPVVMMVVAVVLACVPHSA